MRALEVGQLADTGSAHALRLVDALPRSTLEKVAKAELRRWLAQEPGADGAAPG